MIATSIRARTCAARESARHRTIVVGFRLMASDDHVPTIELVEFCDTLESVACPDFRTQERSSASPPFVVPRGCHPLHRSAGAARTATGAF